jgi:uncharacterized MAPEG superfamily protein
MSSSVCLVVCGALTWIMLVVASMSHSRGWTPEGVMLAFGNRDDMPKPSPFAARADRAAKNMVENLALFAAVLLAASLAGVPASATALPATIFTVSRLLYAPVYWAGIKFVRTAAWSVSLVGLAWIGGLALMQ